MDAVIQPASSLQGTLTLPPDKAVCHRAVLIAALAHGTTDIRPWPAAEDCQRTLELIQALGVGVVQSGPSVQIQGRGRQGLRAPARDLFCGESGTTLRLAAGLLAGQPFASRLCAGPGLSQRPMKRIVEPLTQMGARLYGTPGVSAGASEWYPPVTIEGRSPLKAIRYELRVPSAQVKSAILLAGLFAEGRTTILEPVPTRDHTERLLRRCGVAVHRRGSTIELEPPSHPLASPGALVLPADVSSAAFFAVAAACVPHARLTLRTGLNPTRTSWLRVLTRMGASVQEVLEEDGWEPRGTLTVEARPLHGTTIEAQEIPGLIDELPILMVAAVGATGRTVLHGLAELRVKETDRIHSMVSGLRQLGVQVRLVEPDTVEIDGGPLRGGIADSAGDHRTAMSLAIAGMMAQGATTVRGAECVSKSFPDFFEQLRLIAGSATVKTVDKG